MCWKARFRRARTWREEPLANSAVGNVCSRYREVRQVFVDFGVEIEQVRLNPIQLQLVVIRREFHRSGRRPDHRTSLG